MIGNQRKLREELSKLQHIQEIWDNQDYAEAVRKAEKMSSHSCLDWIDTHIADIGRVAEDYRKTGNEVYLTELRKAVSILQALTEELLFRGNSR